MRRKFVFKSILRGAAIALAAVLLVLGIVLALIDWNVLKRPIERMASAHSGRAVRIDGALQVHMWSWAPTVTFEGLTVGNPPWEAARPMAQVDRLFVQLKLLPLLKGDVILPRVELTRPRVYLHRDASGRANWTFANTKPTNAPAGPPPHLPVVRDFVIRDGALDVSDEILRLKVRGTVQAHEQAAADDPKAFRIEGQGTLNGKPFALHVAGGPLINLKPDEPYPFDLRVEAGDIRVASNGTVKKPFDLKRLALNVQANGGDLADLYYLTHLALPNTPPFELQARIERDVSKIKVSELAGRVGQSDLRGELNVDVSRKRPAVSGDLTSRQLRLADLAASLGTKRGAGAIEPAGSARGARSSKAPLPPDAPLFPDAHLEVNRVRAMDADVRFHARSIEAGSLPLKAVALHVRLDNGVLSLDPFAFELPQGRLSGTARIDARGARPHTRLDLRVKDIQLDQLKGRAPDAKPPLGGVVQAHAVLEGSGDSVHDFLSQASGTVTAILPHGEVRAAFAELTGINVARGVGLLLKGDQERTEVRCGIAEFGVQAGTMQAHNVVFDTENVRITGRGEIRLGPEELDLSIRGEPKKLRLARLRTPIDIRGHLRKPSIGLDIGKTLKQGAIATAIGAALAPIAAVIAFVDPGLAKDENCAALLGGNGRE